MTSRPDNDDNWARQQALEPSLSFIVQAPAGSGKTELLSLRMLNLLGTVTRPDSIIAITFTRKSAFAMRDRITTRLQQASCEPQPEEPYRKQAWDFAKKALANAKKHNWNIIDNPHILRIQTIDSFAHHLASQMPFLSGVSDTMTVVEDASFLYIKAIKNTLLYLDSNNEELSLALNRVLSGLNNEQRQLENLIKSMLQRREQWLQLLGSSIGQSATVTDQIEASIKNIVTPEIDNFIAKTGAFLNQLQPLIANICHLDSEFATQKKLVSWQGMSCWNLKNTYKLATGLRNLLLNSSENFYKRLPKLPKELIDEETSLKDILLQLRQIPYLEKLFVNASRLPHPVLSTKERESLEDRLTILRQAHDELQEVFFQERALDFNEVTLRAYLSLGREDDPSELLLKKDIQIKHLLIDEFQDVSRSQYNLIELLTTSWEEGDGRTLFLVGDPNQSIYRFRDADVSIFKQTWQDGFQQLKLHNISLTANFRSDPGIVDWVNNNIINKFQDQSGHNCPQNLGSPAYSTKNANQEQTAVLEPSVTREDSTEGERVLRIITEYRERHKEHTIGVLTRNRLHLYDIIQTLDNNAIGYQAQEIFPLKNRQSIQDLASLTLALVHLGDRLHWLAILRAPWVALTLKQLHDLAGNDQHITMLQAMADKSRFEHWPQAVITRLQYFYQVIDKALKMRSYMTFSLWIESIWLTLSGPAFIDSEPDDVTAFFRMLAKIGEPAQGFRKTLDTELQRLFANSGTNADSSIQIMTIHKAKGLEFDCVIIPGVDRMSKTDGDRFLLWHSFRLPNLPSLQTLIAPHDITAADNNSLYQYIAKIEKQEEYQETLRLCYVACTRARHVLHLLRSEKTTPSVNTFYKLLGFQLEEKVNNKSKNLTPSSNPYKPDDFSGFYVPDDSWLPDTRLKSLSNPSKQTSLEKFSYTNNSVRSKTGYLIHKYLDIIHKDGVCFWSEQRLKKLSPAIHSALIRLGIEVGHADKYALLVAAALIAVITNPRGYWLLDKSKKESQSELAIAQPEGYKLIRHRLDLSFIDLQGRYRIIDWKTTAKPKDNQSASDFYKEQYKKYQQQLNKYLDVSKKMLSNEVIVQLYLPFSENNPEDSAS